MAVHRVTRVLPYEPHQLAELVADVRAYPQFVKWVTSMRVWNCLLYTSPSPRDS